MENVYESTCWYCGESPGDERATVNLGMHRELSRMPTGQGTMVIKWQSLSVDAPRCARCKRIHDTLTTIGAILSAPLPLYGVIWSLRMFPAEGWIQWLIRGFIEIWVLGAAILVFMLSMWVLAWPGRLIARMVKSRLVPVSETLRMLRREGWRGGSKPGDVSGNDKVVGA